jgi:hypothetical protein
MSDRALLQAQITKETPAPAPGLAPPPSQPVFVQWQGKRVDAQEQLRVLSDRVKAAQADVRAAEQKLAAAQPAGAGAAKAADPKAVWGLDQWRIRAAAGNLPLTDIMDYFRAAIR